MNAITRQPVQGVYQRTRAYSRFGQLPNRETSSTRPRWCGSPCAAVRERCSANSIAAPAGVLQDVMNKRPSIAWMTSESGDLSRIPRQDVTPVRPDCDIRKAGLSSAAAESSPAPPAADRRAPPDPSRCRRQRSACSARVAHGDKPVVGLFGELYIADFQNSTTDSVVIKLYFGIVATARRTGAGKWTHWCEVSSTNGKSGWNRTRYFRSWI